jgi:hypothetical protein
MKTSSFWSGTSCSPEEFYTRFGGMYCPHFQGLQVNRARKSESKKQEVDYNLLDRTGLGYSMEEMSKAKLATSKVKCLLGETRSGQENNIKIMLKIQEGLEKIYWSQEREE